MQLQAYSIMNNAMPNAAFHICHGCSCAELEALAKREQQAMAEAEHHLLMLESEAQCPSGNKHQLEMEQASVDDCKDR